MNFKLKCSSKILIIFLLMQSHHPTIAETVEISDQKDGLILVQNTRISVISATILRVEYSPRAEFIDQPGLRVVNHQRDSVDYSTHVSDDTLIITTKQVQLQYILKYPTSYFSFLFRYRDDNSWCTTIYNSQSTSSGIINHDGYFFINNQAACSDSDKIDLYFSGYGDNYQQALKDYSRLTGAIPLIPRWAYGTWYSFAGDYSDDDFQEAILRFQKEQIPVDVLLIGSNWYDRSKQGYHWRPEYFPKPDEFLEWLHHQGTKVGVVDKKHGNSIGTKSQSTSGLSAKQTIKTVVNKFYQPLMKKGVDFWQIDLADLAGLTQQNELTILDSLFKLTPHINGNRRTIYINRFQGVGAQRFPITGYLPDQLSWQSFRDEIQSSVMAANSGIPFHVKENSGFNTTQIDAELYIRQMQFAALNPILHIHCTPGIPEPWQFDKTTLNIVRNFVKLHHRFIPYLYSNTKISADQGSPLLRPMYIDWPDIDNSFIYLHQYMLGNNLLVAPITKPGENQIATKKIFFPPGGWTDIFSGAKISGPKELIYYCPLDRMPVFARSSSITPLQSDTRLLDGESPDPLILDIYPGNTTTVFNFYEDDGITRDYLAAESRITKLIYRFDDSHQLTISPITGKYPGPMVDRSYEIRFNGITKPEQVLVNGMELMPRLWTDDELNHSGGWYFDANYSWAVIKLPPQPLDNKTTIQILGDFSPNDFQYLSQIEHIASIYNRLIDFALDNPLPKEFVNLIRQSFVSANAVQSDYIENKITVADYESAQKVLIEQLLFIADRAMEIDFDFLQQRLFKIIFDINFLQHASLDEKQLEITTFMTTSDFAPGFNVRNVLTGPDFLSKPFAEKSTYLLPGRGEQISFQFSIPDTIHVKLEEFKIQHRFNFDEQEIILNSPLELDHTWLQHFSISGPFSPETLPIDSIPAVIASTDSIDSILWRKSRWTIPSDDNSTIQIDLPQQRTPHPESFYAATRLMADRPIDAVLAIDGNVVCSLWINNEKLFHQSTSDSLSQLIPIRFREGNVLLLIKLVRQNAKSELSLRITDHDGNSVDGLRHCAPF